ncbi:IS21 family transposase [Nocardia sp. NPDC004750]
MECRVELFAAIRRDARVEGLSIRELARRYQVHRRTVRQALAGAAPPPRKVPARRAPKLDAFKPAIDAMLIADTTAPRKQRHTARRVLARLVEEHGARQLSYSTVRDYVRIRRAQIDLEAGRRIEAFVPQQRLPGQEAEVDFGEVWVMLNGVKTRCQMFVFWLAYSGRAVHRVYPTAGQEAFLEGHIEAFNVIGGVPTRHIRYDNLTSAVRLVLHGSDRRRAENPRWVLFCSHFGIDPFYCQPGLAGSHEKGGVEGEVGRFRRNRLTPMPVVDSLDELNDLIREWEIADQQRRIDGRVNTIAEDFAVEAPLLAPLPVEEFDPGLVLHPRVDRSALVTVRMVKYSVPARLIGRKVRVSLQASQLVIYDGAKIVARHRRIAARTGCSVQLDHYLEVLKIKPGAFPGSTALAQARDTGVFTAAHEAFWAAARRVNGDAEGTRELIEVLLLHRSLAETDVVAGIIAALEVGAVNADVVAVEARRHGAVGSVGGAATGRHRIGHGVRREQRVVSLTQRRLMDPAAIIAGLPPDPRPLPTVTAYDDLLVRRTPVAAPTDPDDTEKSTAS